MFKIDFEPFTLVNENGEQFGVLLSGDTIAGNRFFPLPTKADAKTTVAILAKVNFDNFAYDDEVIFVDEEPFTFSSKNALYTAVSIMIAYLEYQRGKGRRVGDETKSYYNKLKRRASKHGLLIRKYKRGEDSFMLVDAWANTVAAPAPMTLDQVDLWLDDLDDDTEQPF